MALAIILLIILFTLWAVYFYQKMNTLFTVHLKYFFEPNVNLMAKYPVAARYDAINIKEKFWSIYLLGLFIAPLRVLGFILVMSSGQVWTLILMKIYGVNYKNS